MRLAVGLMMLGVAVIASIGVCVLLWYESDRPIAVILSIIMAVGAVILVARSGKFIPRYRRLAHTFAVALAILFGIGIVAAPTRTDRGFSWNEAVKAIRLLHNIVKENHRYAESHHGSYAHSLSDLHERGSIEASYVIRYEPVQDQDGVIRHYSLRAVPQGRFWIHIYADETDVVRLSENGPADRNSRPLL